MRTTVTIDDEVARLLKEAMHRQRTNFKEALNSALRRGLTTPATPPTSRKRFTVKASNLGLRPGIDPTSLNKLAAELEDEEIIRKIKRDSAR
jgi:hypothetical protein